MPAAIFNGSSVKLLKDILKFKTGAQIISGDSDDPTSVAKAGSPSDLYLREGTAEVYVKQDSGTSTNWSLISTGALSSFLQTEYRTITAPESAAKQLTLSSAPTTAANTQLEVIGGTAQQYSVDYTVSGSVLDWNGLGLDGILTSGDKLRVTYETSPSNLKVEYRVISAGEASAKSLVLSYLPNIPAYTEMNSINGTAQEYGIDFTVSGTTLSWNGLGLDGVLAAGDIIRLSYIGT